MSRIHVFCIFVVFIATKFVLSYPFPRYEERRDKLDLFLNELKKPTLDIRCQIKLLSKQMEMVDPRNRLFKHYAERFQQKCILDFSHFVEDTRFLNAMKMTQHLVGLTQDMQLSESRINHGDETQLVTDFRKLEFSIRDLVEDTMRRVAFEILDSRKYQQIPPYSVGGLFDSDATKKDDAKTAKIRNRIKMYQIDECLKIFSSKVLKHDNDINCQL